jgi:3-oxoisoapionate kinase
MAEFGFLADDLTGASDVLAQAHAYGLEAVLALDPERSMTAHADVVGVAGPARSLAGEELDASVRSGLGLLAPLEPSVLLYKVCSTFDSSPTVGSIGRAIELMHDLFPGHGAVPVVPAQPGFGRYTAFSQHFGVYAGAVHRLDRHPVMSDHPSTPMTEADLRLVLAAQFTSKRTMPGLHLPTYADGTFADQWKDLRHRRDTEAFVVDAVDESHMDHAASALVQARPADGPALVVGSGGIMAALARSLSGQPRSLPGPTASTGPTLVVSASASSTTADQITDATQHGWVDVPIPPDALAAGANEGSWTDQVERALRAGRNVVAHTTRGPDDPRLRADRVSAAQVGGTIGQLAGDMAQRGLTRDLVICGGDTSSHALLALGVSELRVSEQFVTAGPICTTDGEAAVAGCRVLLKGGQVGAPDLFRQFSGLA